MKKRAAKLPEAGLQLLLGGLDRGGTAALGALLFMLDGREIVSMDQGRLLIRYEAFGLGWTWPSR